MPLFSRRRLQSMLDELSPLMGPEKARDLLARLENKRVDQVLPAEIELALIWSMATLGELEIEPLWWGDGSRPDVYTEFLIVGEPVAIEIAAPNDNVINGEEAMDRVAQQIGSFVSHLQKGEGNYLRYRFREMSGYEGGKYFRRRLAPDQYELSAAAETVIRDWVERGETNIKALRIVEPGLDVEVERTPYKQTRFHNTWSTMPPETHSLEDNPLYKLLSRKLRQLKAARPGTKRVIFLGDAGSTLINRLGTLGEIDPTRRRVSGFEIISHFVTANQRAVDAVITFSPVRSGSWNTLDKKLRWAAKAFNRPGFTFPMVALERIRQAMPRPRFEGYQARSLFRQGLFNPAARGWWEATTISFRRGGPMEVRVSARSLIDLLAGRVTPEQFRSLSGERPGEKNLFQHQLDSGKTVQGVRFESGGVDFEDDHIIVTFADDPSARKLRLNSE
ncbi:MAG: hypothetical protein ACK4RV_06930 [Caulobacter sp.]